MKLGVLSDVHSDLQALEDAFRQFDRMGCERVVCAGDIVDYGLFPDETIALLQKRGVPCIRGNHDRWATQGSTMASSAGLLSAASMSFLRSLPVTWKETIDGVRVVMWHASPGSDMDGVYPDVHGPADLRVFLERAEADVMIVGHSHLRFRLPAEGRAGGVIVNPGALLRNPAEDLEASGIPTPGTFGVLDLPSKRFTVHHARDGQEAPIIERCRRS